MKLTHPKTKEKVTITEFFTQWKNGIANATPLQQNTSMIIGQFVSLTGVIWGIVFSLIIGYYWMMVILIGALIVLGTQMLGTFQARTMLKIMFGKFNIAEKEVEDVV